MVSLLSVGDVGMTERKMKKYIVLILSLREEIMDCWKGSISGKN
jgi:hypothetical protein